MRKNSTGSIIELGSQDVGIIYSGTYYILGVTWVSDDNSGADIADDDDFLLDDADGFRIAGKRAEAAGDDYGVMFSKPVPVNGLKLTILDGGICVLYVHTL